MLTRRPLPWLLALGLAAAGIAAADDACLTGESTLGDQRSIASLRTDLEAACPCGSMATGGSYRRCAKSVITNALVNAVLRPECERTARRLVKGATCGTSKTTCGRVRATAAEPVSCKVKREAGCTDTPRIAQTACTDQDFCTDVVDWTAGTCSDVRARGPFEAGVTHIVFTKQSAVDPLAPRPLDTYIWYPTTPGAGPVSASTRGVPDAPLDPSGGPYPIVLFSHGSCGYQLQSTFLLPLIASRGYVVVAPPHPGNTLQDGFPNCILGQANSAVERPQDMIFVLDELLAANADPLSPFYGALDPSRIAMTGHSFGGLTTYLVQAIEPRITVAVAMAPATGPGFAGLTVPALTILGEVDTRVSNDNARAAYERGAAPRAIVEIAKTGHYAFSNGCFPGPDCNPPTTTTQAESNDAALRWIIPFIERYLGGKPEYDAFFEAPIPPGVQVERVE